MSNSIQRTLPFDYESLVQALITGGVNRGVTATPTRDVITASAGGTTTYTLNVQVQQEELLIAHQRIQANPYGSDYTLSLTIDGQPVLTSMPLTQEIQLPGANLPPARHSIVYTLTNSAATGQTEVTIDTFGATLSAPNAQQVRRILQGAYDEILATDGGGY